MSEETKIVIKCKNRCESPMDKLEFDEISIQLSSKCVKCGEELWPAVVPAHWKVF